MYSEAFNAALEIFAHTVFIDGKVREEELHAFITEVQKVADVMGETGDISSSSLMRWFITHQERLRNKLKEPDREVMLQTLFKKIKDPAVAAVVFSSIFTIAMSDNEFHQSESGLLNELKSALSA